MDESQRIIQQTKNWGLQTIVHVLGAGLNPAAPDSLEQAEIVKMRADKVMGSIMAEVMPVANQPGPLNVTLNLFVKKLLNWVVDNYKKNS